MPLAARDRRALAARSHALKPRVTISAEALTPGAIAQVRNAFGSEALLKVRIRASNKAECLESASELAQATAAELVACVGRVALLYRPSPTDAPELEGARPPEGAD